MDLKDFVSETIVQISQGLIDAQEKTKDLGTVINPPLFTKPEEDAIVKDNEGNTDQAAQFIDFDICLTVENANNSEAKGKISIFSCSLGGGESSSVNIGNMNRIKFTIPVVFPLHDFDKYAQPFRNKSPKL